MIILTILPEKSEGCEMCRRRLHQCNYIRYKKCEGREEMELSKWWLLVSLGNMCLLGPNKLLGRLNISSCAHVQRRIMIIEPNNTTTTTHNNKNTASMLQSNKHKCKKDNAGSNYVSE